MVEIKIKILNRIEFFVLLGEYVFSDYVFFQVDKHFFRIPLGFTSDGGSVPRLLRGCINPLGNNSNAFFLHDYGYRVQPKGFTREFWDMVMYQQLINDGMRELKAFVIYNGLRVCGIFAWNKNKRSIGG